MKKSTGIKIPEGRLSLLSGKDPDFRKNFYFRSVMELLKPIAESYGFQVSDWTPLAIRLAIELHPDLQPSFHNVKRAGRKRIWDGDLPVFLWADVFDLRLDRPKLSTSNACFTLSKQKFWKDLGLDHKALKVAYSKHVKPLLDKNGYSPKLAQRIVEIDAWTAEDRQKYVSHKPALRQGLPRQSVSKLKSRN
jgi:hypothetical protein